MAVTHVLYRLPEDRILLDAEAGVGKKIEIGINYGGKLCKLQGVTKTNIRPTNDGLQVDVNFAELPDDTGLHEGVTYTMIHDASANTVEFFQ